MISWVAPHSRHSGRDDVGLVGNRGTLFYGSRPNACRPNALHTGRLRVLISAMPAVPIIESLLEPVSRCFTPETARALADLETDEAMQQRMTELAEKANEGELTETERRDYETYVQVGNVIAILQAKARLRLKQAAA